MRLHTSIPDTGTLPPVMTLPRTAWVRLNRLRTGVRCFHSECPIHQPSHELYGLTVLDDETIEWLLNTSPEIQCGQAVDLKNWLKQH